MLVKVLSTQRKLVVCPYGTWLKIASKKTKPSASEASFVLSFTSSFFFVDRCPILRTNHARTYLHTTFSVGTVAQNRLPFPRISLPIELQSITMRILARLSIDQILRIYRFTRKIRDTSYLCKYLFVSHSY